jgi:hypothetical protein
METSQEPVSEQIAQLASVSTSKDDEQVSYVFTSHTGETTEIRVDFSARSADDFRDDDLAILLSEFGNPKSYDERLVVGLVDAIMAYTQGSHARIADILQCLQLMFPGASSPGLLDYIVRQHAMPHFMRVSAGPNATRYRTLEEHRTWRRVVHPRY